MDHFLKVGGFSSRLERLSSSGSNLEDGPYICVLVHFEREMIEASRIVRGQWMISKFFNLKT